MDPDLDWSTGVARGIAGEVFFESPVLFTGTRKRVKTAVSKEVAQNKVKEEVQNKRDQNLKVVVLDEVVKKEMT